MPHEHEPPCGDDGPEPESPIKPLTDPPVDPPPHNPPGNDGR